MDFKAVQEALDIFGDAVIDGAKKNLRKDDMANGSLFKSLRKVKELKQAKNIQVNKKVEQIIQYL